MKKNGLITGLMYVAMVVLTVGLGVLLFFNYQANKAQKEAIAAAQEAAETTPTPPPTAAPEATAVPERDTETITLAFAGDLVGQAGLATDVESKSGEGEEEEVSYDFTEQLSGVVPSISEADLAACTLVSTLGGDGEYDSYHMPGDIADALAEAGFGLVNAATDHILDRGLEGLQETVETLHGAGLNVTGAYSDGASRSLPVADVNGVKVAFLSYTYGTAGTGSDPVSVADNNWCLDILTTDYMTDKSTVDYDKIDADIAAVKEAGADIVVCFVYWWDNAQYYTEPRADQTELADYLFQNGVDILIGGGVKVPQPIRVQTVAREDGNANCVACYSLSNMMSCFNDTYTNISAVASIQISRDTDSGEVWVSGVSYRPLFMLDTGDYEDYNKPGFKYRLLDAADAIEAYDDGDSETLTAESYGAVMTGVDDLESLLGGEYAEDNGGVTLGFPYEAAPLTEEPAGTEEPSAADDEPAEEPEPVSE